jgi:5-methylcytosine-specific restriction endonuclease McrA
VESTGSAAQLKVCTRCGEAKALDQFYGYRGSCKPCWRERQKAYREADPEEARAVSRRYLAKNRAEVNARSRARHAEAPEIAREQNRRWRRENPEKSRLFNAAFHAANPQWQHEYDQRRQAARTLYKRERYQRDPTPYLLAAHNYRARLRAGTVEQFSATDLIADWARRGLSGCVWCTEGKYEHIDHVMPLSRGGAHAMDNLVPSCARCNQLKRHRTPAEWFARLERG